MKTFKTVFFLISMILGLPGMASTNEFAEDAASGVGGAIGSAYGPCGAVVAAIGAKYAVRALNDWVEEQIDEHFDCVDQHFVDETGFTLRNGDGKVFRPNQSPEQAD